MSISSASKRGRPRIDAIPVNVRFPPEQLSALDDLIASVRASPSRPEFIRRVIEVLAGPKDEASRLKTFRTEPDGVVVLDLDKITVIEPDGVYSRVSIRGGQAFRLWEEPERLASSLGFHLHLGHCWIHPEAVAAIAMGTTGAVVHLIDRQSYEVKDSWEKVSYAVDEARRLHGTPVPQPKPDLPRRFQRR